MVKKLNGFWLTRKLKHKCLVKVRPFSLAKVRCILDHVKPTVRDLNPDHIILHCRTNDLSSEPTASQIARSIIELPLSLKSKGNKISVSLIVPRNDNLNSKASEVRIVYLSFSLSVIDGVVIVAILIIFFKKTSQRIETFFTTFTQRKP